MTLVERRLVGRDHLDSVTRLLQHARLVEPDGGLWEAADVQWWWRVDQRPEPAGQPVAFDGDMPAVAAVFTRWKGSIGCDLLGRDAATAEHSALLWEHVGHQFTDEEVSMIVRDDDAAMIAAAEHVGFAAQDDMFATAWLDAPKRPRSPSC